MGVLGHFLYRPSFGAKGQVEYLAFDGSLVAADAEIYAAQVHRLAQSNVHGLIFTGPGAGGGLDADKLDGKHASEFLISETDPIFVASPAYGITIGNIANWNTAFSWGNHAGLYSLLGHDHSGVYEPSGAVATHAALATGIHGVGASTVASVANITTHEGAADPHTVYRLESADHSHQSAGMEAGKLDHGLSMVAASLLDDDHPHYKLRHGISNRTATFAYAAGVLTVTYVASYDVWVNGVKFTKTTDQTVSIPANFTFYYVYFDASGVLTATTTLVEVDSLTQTIVALVYRISATLAAIGDERHHSARDLKLHAWAHETLGARYDSFHGGLTGAFTDTTFSISAGDIWDEDLEHEITPAKTTCRRWYRTALNVITFEDAITTLYKMNGANLRYDNAGTLTNATSNWHVNHYVYATNDVQEPIYSLIGQAQYANLAGARDEPVPAFANLSTVEWKLLYRVTYRNIGATPDYIEAVDYRLASGVPTTFAPAAHGGLTGLLNDDHTQYLLADGTRAADEIRLTPKVSSSGPEGTIFYDSDDDHVWVGTE